MISPRLATNHIIILFIGFFLPASASAIGVYDVDNHISVLDTIPIRDNPYGNFTTDEYNPFDIKPSIVEEHVEYDFETGRYVVFEKIGNEYYRTPTYLTMSEYLDWQQKKQERDHFRKLAGIKSKDFTAGLQLDPMSEIDVEALLIDRLFGGTDIEIKPTGNIDLTTFIFYQKTVGQAIPVDNQVQTGFDFDMEIDMGVEGQIGDKLNLGFNYNTQATFGFDNKLNLGYGSELFDEDDIIKNIEAGDVNFTLPGELIQGQQNLFGLKTELQFGKFFLTAVASQSRSERESITLENGKLIQEFEILPDQYDENRHFFLSHYFRDNFETALENIPQVKSLVRITDIEVWVTNDQSNDLTNATMVTALEYLGETNLSRFSDSLTMWRPDNFNTNALDIDGNRLPSNDVSDLYVTLVNDDLTRRIDNVETNLQTQYGMRKSRDFERHNMRRLSANEYTLNPELGYISLNQRLRPNQVLGVAYEYTYSINGNIIYKVGEMTNESNRGGLNDQEEIEPEDVIFVKLLKSTNQNPDIPSWDLMMKNVYPLNTTSLTQEDFQLDIFFEDNSNNTLIRFIPEPGLRNVPLISLFQLDRLNNYGDPQEDGIFDFVPGITVNQRTGSVIFPVLEPFGNSMRRILDSEELFQRYAYPELYRNTVTQARLNPERNRFLIKGQVKSNTSSEISLGAFNIPQGSVTVRAGSQILREGIDYDIDYGIGRIKILNDSYLQQGVPINVSFEDQGLFNLQQKTMFGLRGELRLNPDFTVGATYMRLFERPFTQKVNIGEDPINNRMFGMDINFTKEAPGITNFLDRLPLLTTDAPSSVSFSAEVAALRPGNARAINAPDSDQGVVSLDDFEGANSGIPLSSRTNAWTLASPGPAVNIGDDRFIDDVFAGANRALLNWYVIDDRSGRVFTQENQANPYTRRILQDELFDIELDQSQIPDLRSFDMTYYPRDRGPYNFDTPEGLTRERGPGDDFPPMTAGVELVDDQIQLKDPQSRWAGIMRYLPNNDFEAANYEYIEFWMLNPFIDTEDVEHPARENGTIEFHLGNVSEDILRDNLQFYENAIPTENNMVPIRATSWGDVPLSIPNVQGFDLEFQEEQDLGFDGMSNAQERVKHAEYVNAIETAFNIRMDEDISNDDYVAYLDERFPDGVSVLERYRNFNNPEGNALRQNQLVGLGNTLPDAEDLNDNRSLETNESYFGYTVNLENGNGEILISEESEFITDTRLTVNPVTGEEEKWYRFQIPIASPNVTVGDISSLRSIQFLRMIVSGFEEQKTFRLADFELVRNQWFRLPIDCQGNAGNQGVDFIVNEVGIQENSRKEPFRYVTPKGIVQERIFSTFSPLLQDENSLALNVIGLPDSCEMMISRGTRLDMRQFDELELFTHAAKKDPTLEDGDISVFVRIGKDFRNNYYEYELPMVFSDSMIANSILPMDGMSEAFDLEAYQAEVWQDTNFISFPLRLFQEAKIARNNAGAPVFDVFDYDPGNPEQPNARVRIKGNPTLGLVKAMVIGVRNTGQRGDESITAEVWVNELRLKGLSNRGGVAALARADIQLADLGNVTASYNYSSVGFGQIDEQVQERSLESVTEFDVAANLQLGKLFPQKWALSVPFYYQYAKSTSTPEFDPLELDLTKDELLENTNLSENERTDIVERQKDITEITTFNFTNVRKERTSQGKPKPWDISNLSTSYSFSRIRHSDEIIKDETTIDQRGDLSYNYNAQSKPLQPFQKVNIKALRFIKEFNFNPVPNSFSFNTQLQRYKSSRLFRLPDPAEGFEYVFDDQRFTWDRNYSLSWDLAKSLKLNFDATASAVVDELKQVGVAPTAEDRIWKDVMGNEFETDENGNPIGESFTDRIANDPSFADRYLRDNLRDLGRMKLYNQGISVSYKVPFRYFPGLDWIDAQVQYNGDYTWNAASLTSFDQDENVTLGNIIQNTQRRSLRGSLDFEELYEKIPYFKKLEGKNRRTTRRRRSRSGEEGEEESTAENREISTFEKIFVRPLLSIRELKFNYVEDRSTTIPGYLFTPKFFGLTGSDPGIGFTLGAQPNLDNFLDERGERIITPSLLQNQQIIQENTQTYEADLTIEPWKDFVIDVDFRKTYTEDHTEYYINAPVDPGTPGIREFQRLTQRDFGGFEITYVALNTLFDSDIDGLFTRFEDSRSIISGRLPNDGSGAAHDTDLGFARGFGRQHVDVLVPAFLAAYTNEDPNAVDLDFRDRVRRRGYIPKPNWQLTYNGLGKVGFLKDVFSNITLRHSYKTSLNVNTFRTDLQYNPLDQFLIDPSISTGNYFARFEVPEIVIDERFQPIIGLDFRTKSDLSFNADYSKSRSLRLATTLAQLTEARTTSFTVGLGWTFQDVKIGFLTGGNSKRSRRRNQDPENPENPDSETELPTDDRRGVNSGGVNDEANRLEFTFDLQFRDDVSFIHELDDGQASMPNRGTRTLSFSPVINYDINKNFVLSLYLDYSATRPYLSNQVEITNIEGGLTARFILD